MSPGASAQTPLFTENSEIEAVIEGPISTIVRSARRSTDPHPGAFILTDGGAQRRFEIAIQARGISRRTLGICTFPPLRLNFDGDAVSGTLMRGQNRLKLVTRCRPGASYEQFVVLEYLAYRLYNEITPVSYGVRPVRITYRDTSQRGRENTQLNFLIEDTDDLARRNGRWVELEVQPDQISAAQLDPAATARYALFQFMIGNLDWDMVSGRGNEECCHNSNLIAASETASSGIIPVPYDFDSSGFVDTPYAAPPVGLPVNNVRQRYYRGYCMHNDQARAAADHFRSRRSALLALIDGEQRLNANSRNEARRYIERFFDIISDPGRFNRELTESCRGRSRRGGGDGG
ncbi:MAG: hypothetical protein K2P58_05565 [Hyphomonadaceae bacterium]|nr:hypothetical protein [Hyphomonadaceae bacterium]